MALLNQEKSHNESSAPSRTSEVNEAQANLANCLESYDQHGEEGLQEALDQIYPRTGHYRIEIPGSEGSYARIGPRLPASAIQANRAEPEQ